MKWYNEHFVIFIEFLICFLITELSAYRFINYDLYIKYFQL